MELSRNIAEPDAMINQSKSRKRNRRTALRFPSLPDLVPATGELSNQYEEELQLLYVLKALIQSEKKNG